MSINDTRFNRYPSKIEPSPKNPTPRTPRGESKILNEYKDPMTQVVMGQLLVVFEPSQDFTPDRDCQITLDKDQIDLLELFSRTLSIRPSDIAYLFIADDLIHYSGDEDNNKLYKEEQLVIKCRIIDRLALAIMHEYMLMGSLKDNQTKPEEIKEERRMAHANLYPYYSERLRSGNPAYCLSKDGSKKLSSGLKKFVSKFEHPENSWQDIYEKLLHLLDKPNEINGLRFEKLLSSFHDGGPMIGTLVGLPSLRKTLQMFGVKNSGLYGLRVLFSELDPKVKNLLEDQDWRTIFDLRHDHPHTDLNSIVETVEMIPDFSNKYFVASAVWKSEYNPSIKQSIASMFAQKGIDVTADNVFIAKQYKEEWAKNHS